MNKLLEVYHNNNKVSNAMCKLLEVYHSDNKIRKGANEDGGYVMIALEGGYDCYLSCGVCDEESFSRDFITSYNMSKSDCYAFDGTIVDYPWQYTTNINFVKKNINSFVDQHNTDLSFLTKKYNNIFLKMDIEGGEYPWLLAVDTTILQKFKQIVIEFHGINDHGCGCLLSDKQKCLEKLNSTHYLVHAHGNNNSTRTGNIPDVLELTYVNKKCFSKVPDKNKVRFPIQNLDYPNNLSNRDFVLNTYPFVN